MKKKQYIKPVTEVIAMDVVSLMVKVSGGKESQAEINSLSLDDWAVGDGSGEKKPFNAIETADPTTGLLD